VVEWAAVTGLTEQRSQGDPMIKLRTAIFAPIGVLVLLASFAVPTLVDAKSNRERFEGNLTGAQEAPTPRVTPASGRGRTELRDGNELRYDVHVHHIQNVFVSHIHAGEVGVAGPVCVTLYGPVAVGGGREDGKLADGTATALDANLSAAALTACGGSWEGFLALHRAGKTYVNVHTNDGVPPTDTGPGDFPGGEIRGQMLPRDD
jgi:hypothetical protein